MGKIKIMMDNVRATNQSISTSVPVLNQVKSGVLTVKSGLYSSVLRRNGIASSLNTVNTLLADIISRTNNLTKAIDLYVRLYEQNERKLTEAEVKSYLTLISSTVTGESINAAAFIGDMSISENTKLIDKLIGASKINKFDYNGRFGIASLFAGGSSGGGGVCSWGPSSYLKEYKESTALWQLDDGNETWSLLGKDITKSKREKEIAKYLLKYSNIEAGSTVYIGKISSKSKDSTKAGYEFKDLNKDIEDGLKKRNLFKEDKTSRVRDLETGEVTDGKDQDVVSKKKATLYEKEFNKSESFSLFDYKKTAEGKYTNGSVNAKVMNAEIEGSFSYGLYAVDKDGKSFLSPGVSAKVGISASAFELDAEGQIGSDMLGGYGKGNVKVLAGEASAGIGLGLVNGKLEVTADAGAEVVIFEAEAEAGVNVLGGELGVSGSVKVGIGAKADFGYSDGKIKCEIGASLGLGVEIGFEADIGGMVDTVTDVADKAVKGAQKGAESAIEFVSKGWNRLFG